MRIATVAFIGVLAASLSGCAMTSDVMDAGNGNYVISAAASPIRGGAAGASDVAYKDANKYCAAKGSGFHAIVNENADRDVYQSSAGGSFGPNGGSFAGGTFAAGRTNLSFHCGT